MKISLLGMSGVGKTYWAKKLEKQGFKRFSCDDLIAQELQMNGTADLSQWMGQPFEKQYAHASRVYLHLEEKVVEDILGKVEELSNNDNTVIDTTGSVIYLSDNLLKQLAARTMIVHLETPISAHEAMYKIYLDHPKPVIWGNVFRKINGEGHFEALSRCYPKLLLLRSRAYKNLAHTTIGYNILQDPNFSAEELIELLSSRNLYH